MGLRDAHGRKLDYLRLSVTERCNFRCVYCLPDGCPRQVPRPLSLPELRRLLSAFGQAGFTKVRLTGGEPTTRPDLVEIVRAAAQTPGIAQVGLTTNGSRLDEIVGDLREAGLTSLNVSLDSLAPGRFAQITGSDTLDRVVRGIEAALRSDLPRVKVNAVLLRGLSDEELDGFLAWTRGTRLEVRFIELMRTRGNQDLFQRSHLPAREIHDKLLARGWAKLPREAGDGPAQRFAHPGHQGSVGLIAPYDQGFCATCNRVRVTSTGALRLCLFDGHEIPLAGHLYSDAAAQDLPALIEAAVRQKPAHGQHVSATGEVPVGSFFTTGG